MANMVCEQLAFRLFEKFVQQIRSGNVIESMQALSGIAPILVLLSPYIYGFHSQAPSRIWLTRSLSEDDGRQSRRRCKIAKRAWFTDTLEDVNGVANTIRKMTAAGVAAGREPDRHHFPPRSEDRRYSDQEFPADRRIRVAGVRTATA